MSVQGTEGREGLAGWAADDPVEDTRLHMEGFDVSAEDDIGLAEQAHLLAEHLLEGSAPQINARNRDRMTITTYLSSPSYTKFIQGVN